MNSSLYNSSSDYPLVSIITATFNSSSYIGECYKSIRAQSIGDWEWLVTDDFSSDSTLEVIKSIAAEDSRVKYFTNDSNVGAGASRNNSLGHARGKYIAFLDSDDLWSEDKLLLQTKFMESDVDFSFTGFSVIDKEGRLTGQTVDTTLSGAFHYSNMLKKQATLGCSTVLLRRSKILGERMPVIRTGQDYAFWLQLLKSGLVAEILPLPLTQYRLTPGSISSNKFKKAARQWSIYRRIEGLSILYSMYCFCFYVFRAVVRRK